MSWATFTEGLDNTVEGLQNLTQTVNSSITETSENIKNFELPKIQTSSEIYVGWKTYLGLGLVVVLVYLFIKKTK